MEIPFDLLSDWDRTTTPKFGAFNELQILANRWSYLIDKDGTIIYTQHSGLNEPRDIDAMMEAADKLFAE